MTAFRMGVDIGGTFTDLVLMDEDTGALHLVKMASTPRDPSVAFLNVVQRALRETGKSPAGVGFLAHGTTVATNTIIEGKGARTALIATRGFRDVFEIARQIRPRLYDIFCDKPPPLVPRHLCFEVPERLDARGRVLTPLDEQAAREVVEHLRREAVEAVAVCLLHAYANPAHERRVAALLREAMPGVAVSVSSELCPEMREYYRASTTAINALIMPVVGRYVGRLEARLSEIGVAAPLHLMTSSGGMTSAGAARREPVHLIESGPAAGATAAIYVGQSAGFENLISFDMGGTTAKLGLVEEGRARVAPHFEVGSAAASEGRSAGYPVRTPVVDLVEIGAGGGSLAWIDPGGALRVGPRSAGADPGPACYARGNDQPTITDANLVLGRLNPDYFLGGEQRLRTDLARAAVQRLADRLGLGLTAAAHGILEIANAGMVGAIHRVSVQRGFDPREFVLVAFGGAGPLHANALARELRIPRLLVPPSPGVTSALGLLVGDLKHSFVQACIGPAAQADWGHLDRVFAGFERRGREVLASEGIPPERISFVREVDVRYAGQSYELTVSAPAPPLGPASLRALNETFFAAHRKAYGYAAEDEPTELVNLRLTAVGAVRRPAQQVLEPGGPDAGGAVKGCREVYFHEAGEMVPCDVYDRYRLQAGNRLAGPAVVEEIDSTVVIHPGYAARVDRGANILIEEART
jgi:N-methylhydantoinase A